MSLRANWKGVLKLAELSCPISLFTAVSTSERIAFHTLNRKTGHRVHRQWMDSETGAAVAPENVIKGFDTGNGHHIPLSAEDIAAAIPESDKTLRILCFVGCDEVDPIYFDRPYYIAPSSDDAAEGFAALRNGMREKSVAALARVLLFRRMRTLLLQPDERGLLATMLNFAYEVRPEQEAFADIPKIKIEREMLDLAQHIIKSKSGTFDPAEFSDRYKTALADLVKAKLEGRKIEPPKRRAASRTPDLLGALRQSAGVNAAAHKPARPRAQRKAS